MKLFRKRPYIPIAQVPGHPGIPARAQMIRNRSFLKAYGKNARIVKRRSTARI